MIRNSKTPHVKARRVGHPRRSQEKAVEAGYNVYGVVDASGALDVTTRELAIARMKDHGVTPINWTTVAVELQRDWRLPTGQDLGRIFHDHYQSYGLLMDSFESVTAKAAQKAS